MRQLITFCFLISFWVLFSGQLDMFHLGLGLLSAAFVTWFSSDLIHYDGSKGPGARLRQGARMARYLVWLSWQIVVANLHVFYLAVHPHGVSLLEPRLLKFKSSLKSDFARFALAHSITLTPGTITVKIDGDEFWVHAISAKAAISDVVEGMEARISRLYDDSRKGS